MRAPPKRAVRNEVDGGAADEVAAWAGNRDGKWITCNVQTAKCRRICKNTSGSSATRSSKSAVVTSASESFLLAAESIKGAQKDSKLAATRETARARAARILETEYAKGENLRIEEATKQAPGTFCRQSALKRQANAVPVAA